MNIVCATDDNYVQHCGVMLTSLFRNNLDVKIHVYLLIESLTDKNKKSLEKLVNQYNGFLHFCVVDSSLLSQFPMSGENAHVTLASYNRFFITQFLPEKENRALYLDCDIIICSSLRDLWNFDLGYNVLGTVKEYWHNKSSVYAERLGYHPDYSYFNAGVLLIDLKRWREMNVTQKLVDYTIKYPEKVILHDQDVLNAVLHSNWIELPFRWNLTPDAYFYEWEKKINPIYLKKISEAIQNPAIIHFLSTPKPWSPACLHPMKREYFYYLQFTEWKSFRPKYTIYRYVRFLGGNILRFLGLKKKVYVSFTKRAHL